MNINLLVLKTPRPAELASFYEKLGVQFEQQQHDTGPMHYAAQIDGIIFEIYPLPKNREKADDTLRLGFTVDDLLATVKRLKDSGAKIIQEPVVTEWGYGAVVEDLDGRKVELKRFGHE
jgi:lactoylglutathione lyase